MSLDNFITNALDRSTDTIAYSVSRRLREMFPDRAILEGGDESAFDLLEFARAGKCAVTGEPRVHNQFTTEWRGVGRPLVESPLNAWFDVLWEGHLLDVVYLTWTDEGYRTRFCWIAAETAELAGRFFRAVCEWCSEVHGEVLVFQRGEWRKDDALYAAIKGATFDTLVLPEALARELRDDVARFFASKSLFEGYGVPWKRGILLTGPPGNGKTHTVKAVVNAAARPCLYVKGFQSKYSTAQENMQTVFARARHAAPCVLVFEDLDSLVDDRSRSFFLNELDGFAPNTGIFTVGTSNYPERIDPALVDRPGRFDRTYAFSLPAESERRTFVGRWNETLRPEMRLSDAGMDSASGATGGFSFAYLKELLVSSTMEWVQHAGAIPMDAVVARRASALEAHAARCPPPPPRDDEDDDE